MGTGPDELRDVLRPLASLIGKSEKALGKLRPGTWQHGMLGDNLAALRMAQALLNGEVDAAQAFRPEALREVVGTMATLIGKVAKAQAGFAPGTAHHTLQRNRLMALQVAEARLRAELDKLAGNG